MQKGFRIRVMALRLWNIDLKDFTLLNDPHSVPSPPSH